MPLKTTESFAENDFNNVNIILKLQVLESLTIPQGRELIITSKGLVGTERKVTDGISYFGTQNINVKNSA